jgi:hypothetical protein
MNRFVLSLVAPILGLLLVATDAKAMSGNELMESCKGLERSAYFGYCVGYVNAVADVAMAKMKKDLCIPPAVTQLQLAKVAVKWLEENPDKLHFSANSLVSAALANSFKCN